VKRTHLAEKLHFLGAHRPTVALVDHHETMSEFRGAMLVDLSIVHTSASSTSELVYRYLHDSRVAVSPTMATALLAGVVTDTGGFQNLATTLESFDVAGELMNHGANLRKVVTATMRNKSVGTLQLWGRALSRLEHDPATGIVSTALTQNDFLECNVGRESTEGVANFLNVLGEGSVVLVLREEERGMVKGSYRTKQPGIDVRVLAKEFGGGGHVKAAGFSVRGTIEKGAHGWTVRRHEAASRSV
jgi:phosphoesterase RecJ-like protein